MTKEKATPKSGPNILARMPVNDTAIQAAYEGMTISFTGTAWFNATAAAKRYNRRLDHWLSSEETRDYIAALAEVVKSPESGEFVHTQRGRSGGTWLHPKLGVLFARHCDARFAVWCDTQIDHILRGGLALYTKANDERSTTPDREPLLTAAAAIVARHRLPFSAVYEALNTFAGVAHAREMTCAQVLAASDFGARVLSGTATTGDYRLLEQRRIDLGLTAPQLSLLGGVQ